MTCASSEDSDKPGHLPCLISLRSLFEKKVGSLATRTVDREDFRVKFRLGDAQVDLSLRYVHRAVAGFVVCRLNYCCVQAQLLLVTHLPRVFSRT